MAYPAFSIALVLKTPAIFRSRWLTGTRERMTLAAIFSCHGTCWWCSIIRSFQFFRAKSVGAYGHMRATREFENIGRRREATFKARHHYTPGRKSQAKT